MEMAIKTRSFCYVDDLIDGFVRYMNIDKSDNNFDFPGPINLGNPNEYRIGEIAEIIVKLTNAKSKIIYMPLPQDDPKQRQPDINNAKRILNGWEPCVELEEGLTKTISYFQKHIINKISMKSDNLLLIKKSLSFLNKAEKLTGIKVLFLVVGMAIFEIIGIASIMPFLTILGDQGMIYENEYLALMYDFSKTIGVISTNDFLIFLGIGSFSLIIISAVYRTITQYYMNKFIEMRRHEIGLNLFAKLHQSILFILYWKA